MEAVDPAIQRLDYRVAFLDRERATGQEVPLDVDDDEGVGTV